MWKRVTPELLLSAGFLLTDCSDGKFWVLEREAGVEAVRIAAVCRAFLPDMDTEAVLEELVLQCDVDFKDPALYVDGFLWRLSPRDFSGIVSRLARRGRRAQNRGGTRS